MSTINDESKDSIRRRIWDYLESNNIADFPRPAHHRIPNFKGAAAACQKLQAMDAFIRARTIKVNPDKPQQHARFLALEANKTLLVPTPRLRKGLFNRIVPPPGANKNMLRTCSSSQGVREYSSPIGLDADIKVDVVIIGSVAVSPQGYRIGKGEGYADMEFAMMSSMGAVIEDTVVITTVHDCQVLDRIPEHLFGEHDLGVDIILTPTRTIKCDNKRPRPHGILWHLLSREKFSQMPILKILRTREAELGKDVRLRDEVQGGSRCQFSAHSSSQARIVKDSAARNDSSPCSSRTGREDREAVLKTSPSCSSHEKKTTYHPTTTAGEESGPYNRSGEVDSERRTKDNSCSGQRTVPGQTSHAPTGTRPPSNRRRDLGNMFAWNK